MVKLSNLVQYKHNLEDLLLDPTRIVQQHCSGADIVVAQSPIDLNELPNQIRSQQAVISDQYDQFNKLIGQTIEAVDVEIKKQQAEYYRNTELLYKETVNEPVEYIQQRRLEITDDKRDMIQSTISHFSNWRYPGMMIRPINDDWIDHMVGSDPLYLVDLDKRYIDPAIEKFSDQYKKRLAIYEISETDGTFMLENLPNGQLSFCLCYYFLDFRPLEIVQLYIEEVYNKLRPGGCFAFTFNNCDRWGGVRLAEQNFASYTPASVIYNIADNCGYEVRKIDDLNNATTWVELVKPGELSSLRAGQNLAQVVDKI